MDQLFYQGVTTTRREGWHDTMATLIFLVLHMLKQLNSQQDSYIFCILLALEGPQYLRIWLWWKTRQP